MTMSRSLLGPIIITVMVLVTICVMATFMLPSMLSTDAATPSAASGPQAVGNAQVTQTCYGLVNIGSCVARTNVNASYSNAPTTQPANKGSRDWLIFPFVGLFMFIGLIALFLEQKGIIRV